MKHFIFSVFFVFVFLNFCFSQEKWSIQSSYELYDAFIGNQNSEVYNGSEYIDEYPEFKLTLKTNNKFYGTYNFSNVNVIYNNQPYFDLKIKYDLLNDLLIVEFVNEKVNYLSLNSEMISQFEILGSKFIRLNKIPALSEYYKNGFFKESFTGSVFSLYVKYHKNRSKKRSENKVFYSFKEQKHFFVQNESNFYRIEKKTDVLEMFPSFEKEIRSYYKKHTDLRKKNTELFFINLFKNLDQLKTNQINN